MATTRATGYVVTAAVWNAVLSCLNDAGTTYTGAFNGSTVAGTTGTFSSTLAVTGAVTLSSTLAVTGAATFSSTIKELGRTTAIGHWIAVTYDANNFTRYDAPTEDTSWDVASADITTNRYMLVGKTLFWQLYIAQSSITNTADELRAYIPGGFTIGATGSFKVAYFNDNGTVRDNVIAEPISGTTYVRITRTDGSAFTNSTNGTYLYMSVWMEVQ